MTTKPQIREKLRIKSLVDETENSTIIWYNGREETAKTINTHTVNGKRSIRRPGDR